MGPDEKLLKERDRRLVREGNVRAIEKKAEGESWERFEDSSKLCERKAPFAKRRERRRVR